MPRAHLIARLVPQPAGGYAVASFGIYSERWPTDRLGVLHSEIVSYEADTYDNAKHLCWMWAKAARLSLQDEERADD